MILPWPNSIKHTSRKNLDFSPLLSSTLHFPAKYDIYARKLITLFQLGQLDSYECKYKLARQTHFSAFSSLWLTFSWGFHTYMLSINRTGSVSKTSDTWWKYRYTYPPARKYRQYRYLVLVSCPSLPLRFVKKFANRKRRSKTWSTPEIGQKVDQPQRSVLM